MTIKELKSVYSIEDLESLRIGRLMYDIGGRGGHVAFRSSDVARALGVPEYQLTPKVGAYCNYLGGGIRGAVQTSQSHHVVDKRKRRLIEELCEACKRAYLTAEEDLYMDEWDEMATQAARDAGIASAY